MSDVNVSGNLTVTKSGTINKDLLVKGWLYAANVRDMYVGVYESSSQLPADAKENSIAGVVTTVSGVEKIVAWCKGGSGWESTGAELEVDVDTATQQEIDAINAELANKANKSEMKVTEWTGANADKVTIKLRNGTGYSITVLKSHQSLNGCMPIGKVEFNEQIAVFDNGGKVVGSGKKPADYAAVNHNHSGVYALVNHTHSGYALVNHTHSGYATTTEMENVLSGFCCGEIVRVTYSVTVKEYHLSDFYGGNFEELQMAIIDGHAYNDEGDTIQVESAGDLTIYFLFTTSRAIPENAFVTNLSLNKVHLPSYIHEIGDRAFYGCIEMTEIECESMTPPTLGAGSLDNITLDNVTLRVHNVVKGMYSDTYSTLVEGGLKLEDIV